MLNRREYPQIELDEDLHRYTVTYSEGTDPIVVPSVTSILGPFLYNYPKTEPSIRLMALGKSVHAATVLWETSDEPFQIPTDVSAYLQAYKDFFRDTKPRVILREAKVASYDMFAGTLDRAMVFPEEDRISLVEIKTGGPPLMSAYAQLWGYQEGVKGTYLLNQVMYHPYDFRVVRLLPTGKYRMYRATPQERTDAGELFRACHRLWEYRRKQGWT